MPREIQFKAENIMIFGILLGPNEVHLHYINYYLASIVNKLHWFWDGVQISTYENPSGKIIQAALILCLCDISAARKLCGYTSALVACYCCKKKVQYENRHYYFEGINDINA